MPKIKKIDALDFSGKELSKSLETVVINTLKTNNPISVFFNKKDLNTILAEADCQGIRFYPALDKNGDYTATAIGVNTLREELIASSQDKTSADFSGFIRSEGTFPSTFMDVNEFSADVKRMRAHLNVKGIESPFLRQMPLEERDEIIFTVYFSREELNDLLTEQAIGIRLYLDEIELTVNVGINIDGTFQKISSKFDTFTAVSVGANMADAPEIAGYRRSAAPCPPDCGEQDDYTPTHTFV